jgi:hypothetical protein
MNSKYSLLMALLFFGLIYSCSKSTICGGEDINKGIIVKYYNVHDFPMCVQEYVNENKELIIRNNNELLNITDSNCYNLPEVGYSTNPPDINFNEYSLLGFYSSGQCEVKFIREVTKNEINQKYTYKIIVNDCGTCKIMKYDANLVLVPKIPDDFIVDFVLEYSD